MLQWVKADQYNPISQAIVRISDTFLKPLRSFVPSTDKVDSASLIFLFALQYISITLATTGTTPTVLVFATIAAIVSLIANILFWSIFILSILSWFQSSIENHPGITLLRQFSAPILNPIRKLIPANGGVDFTPIIGLLGVKIFEVIVTAILQDLARAL
jgi:YggT family protein